MKIKKQEIITYVGFEDGDHKPQGPTIRRLDCLWWWSWQADSGSKLEIENQYYAKGGGDECG